MRRCADDVTMTSYDDDQTSKHHHYHRHHHHHHHPDYQPPSFFDELHRDLASPPLPDLCPRDIHTGSTSDDYYFLFGDHAGRTRDDYRFRYGDRAGNISDDYHFRFGNHHAGSTPDECADRSVSTSDDDYYFRFGEDEAGGGGGRVCAGCMVPIRDRHYLSAVGSNWHVPCLVCCECRRPLDRQSTCYVHDARGDSPGSSTGPPRATSAAYDRRVSSCYVHDARGDSPGSSTGPPRATSAAYVHDARIYCRDDYFASVPAEFRSLLRTRGRRTG